MRRRTRPDDSPASASDGATTGSTSHAIAARSCGLMLSSPRPASASARAARAAGDQLRATFDCVERDVHRFELGAARGRNHRGRGREHLADRWTRWTRLQRSPSSAACVARSGAGVTPWRARRRRAGLVGGRDRRAECRIRTELGNGPCGEQLERRDRHRLFAVERRGRQAERRDRCRWPHERAARRTAHDAEARARAGAG